MLFTIADFNISITSANHNEDLLTLLPWFKPFKAKTDGTDDMLFSLHVDDAMRPVPKEQRTHIRIFDTGNGNTKVDRTHDGGYQYIIQDIQGRNCCLLITDSSFTHCRCALNGDYNMRQFGLNNALMLSFAFSACRYHTVLIHASLVRHEGYGYAFTAQSGTGKSTQVSFWLRYIPQCDLMNDDNPIIRIIDGRPYIYGSPWSGKTPCYRNIKAPLGAITQIHRAPENSIEPLRPIEAFATLLPACSTMKWDEHVFDCICNTISNIISTTSIYTLHCLPNAESALLCKEAISKQNN